MPSRGRSGQSSDPVGKSMEPTTTDQEETYVSASLARFYLTHLTATLIHYQGFTSCQAEVIAELERKVEERKYRILHCDTFIVISLNLTSVDIRYRKHIRNGTATRRALWQARPTVRRRNLGTRSRAQRIPPETLPVRSRWHGPRHDKTAASAGISVEKGTKGKAKGVVAVGRSHPIHSAR